MNNEETKSQDREEQNLINAIKKEFEGQIDVSFLIRMRKYLLDNYKEEIFNCFKEEPEDNLLLKGNPLDYLDLELCRNIVGIHNQNMLYMTPESQRQHQNQTYYKRELSRQVINHLKLRRYAGMYARVHRVSDGQEFLFYSTAYKLFALGMRAKEIIKENPRDDDYFYRLIFEKAISASILIESNAFADAYLVSRSLIEIFIRALVIDANPGIFDVYAQFVGFQLDRLYNKTYSDEFYKLYNARKKVDEKDKLSYLYFGWVDSIDDFSTRVKGWNYNFYSLMKYLESYYFKNKYVIEVVKGLRYYYKYAHLFTHGIFGNVNDPLQDYLNIVIIVLEIIIPIAYQKLCKKYGIDPKINGLDVVQMVDDESHKIYLATQPNGVNGPIA